MCVMCAAFEFKRSSTETEYIAMTSVGRHGQYRDESVPSLAHYNASNHATPGEC
jgi:hypothetical protein